ncbi:MAG TPA: hypothetical protein VEH06_05590 [Candidatus Bathyarchaeia archaeon]|nr:hypothetical protein [Candidatus Bathyarchaeia archaeon]
MKNSNTSPYFHIDSNKTIRRLLNIHQLSKALGNNSKILSSNIKVGSKAPHERRASFHKFQHKTVACYKERENQNTEYCQRYPKKFDN